MDLHSKLGETLLFVQNKWSLEFHFGDISETASTLNIPQKINYRLNLKIDNATQLRQYLHQVLNRYRAFCYSGALPNFSTVKTKFQDKGQNMVRRSFRPYDGDWAELKLIASMHGLTATFLFVVLIEMDFDQATAGKLDAAFEGVDPTELLAHPISFTQTIHKIPGKIKKYSRFWKNFHRFKTMQNH